MGKFKDQQIRDRDAALQPMRVGDLAGLRAHVEANCNRCGHHAVIDRDHVMRRVEPQAAVPELGMVFVCTSCGSRDVTTRPAWPNHWEYGTEAEPDVTGQDGADQEETGQPEPAEAAE